MLTAFSIPLPCYGAWIQNRTSWLYEENQVYQMNIWKQIDGAWFYFNQTGYMVTDWKLINNKWYFLNPISDGTKGKMLIGWQWIDGRCYYLANQTDGNGPEGAMYVNTRTPDGYLVDGSGAWTDESGVVQSISGKGIQTPPHTTIKSKSRFSGGGSLGGGSGRSRRKIRKGTKDKYASNEQGETEPKKEEPKNQKDNRYMYTIKYLDRNHKTVLKLITGSASARSMIPIEHFHMEGYEICRDQKQDFILSKDGMIIIVFYTKEIDHPETPSKETPSKATPSQATPSEAKKVSWKLYFVEEGDENHEIFKPQSGKTEEGKELVVDFPEMIQGADNYYYHSTVPSPWSHEIDGTGIQKYYITFERGEKLPEQKNPDQEAREQFKTWLERIREADASITGEESTDQQIITDNLEESNDRILNLVSMARGTDRKEIYLAAKGHIPNSVIIGQTFSQVTNVSELLMDQLDIGSDRYTILRIGFTKTNDEKTGSHDYEVIQRVEPICIKNGYEILRCRNTGEEVTVQLPAKGHTDEDQDGICDVCYEPVEKEPETIHYNVGDIQARTIGNKIYLFRCIDDDYEDAMENHRQTALFLCDRVIRSDIDGAGKKLFFGANNNYKYSDVRRWLTDHAIDNRFAKDTYIGITESYSGATKKGTYNQFLDSSLMGFDRLYQPMEDKIFILSVEEAMKYRDYLWKFNGSEENNPQSQITAYSKGYYLRTPQDSGRDEFRYGEGIYAVSLVDGNIKPINVRETSIGIRPVMAVPQG